MEKRLQLLLDQERYDRVAGEAARSGRSVAAVIREAIDMRFADAEADARRAAAGASFLAMTAEPDLEEPAMSWPEIKAEMEQEMIDKFDRLYSR